MTRCVRCWSIWREKEKALTCLTDNSRNNMKKRKLITFDWAMKRLQRSKANFEILEGFLSELLNEQQFPTTTKT